MNAENRKPDRLAERLAPDPLLVMSQPTQCQTLRSGEGGSAPLQSPRRPRSAEAVQIRVCAMACRSRADSATDSRCGPSTDDGNGATIGHGPRFGGHFEALDFNGRCQLEGSRALQDLIRPSGIPTVPVYLQELPESVVEAPPVEIRIQQLPCDQLSWQDFERLVFRLARQNPDIVYCARYGRPGQAQDGIDVYARLAGGGHICWQARNWKDVGPSDIENAVDDFLKGKWAASAERFVYCVRASLADTALQDTIEAQAARLLEEGIVFEGVDGTQLSEKLRSHPEIVDDFFGRSWLVAFVGTEAVASLKRPLKVQRVIALRRRLAEIYNARAQQLDPGLNVDPGWGDTHDIRKRFVVPMSIRLVRSSSRRLSRRTGPPRRPERTTTPGGSTTTVIPPNLPNSAGRRANRP